MIQTIKNICRIKQDYPTRPYILCSAIFVSQQQQHWKTFPPLTDSQWQYEYVTYFQMIPTIVAMAFIDDFLYSNSSYAYITHMDKNKRLHFQSFLLNPEFNWISFYLRLSFRTFYLVRLLILKRSTYCYHYVKYWNNSFSLSFYNSITCIIILEFILSVLVCY